MQIIIINRDNLHDVITKLLEWLCAYFMLANSQQGFIEVKLLHFFPAFEKQCSKTKTAPLTVM